ncbi:MAG TPA: hypothetical protein EYH43_03755 [Persephonella sp.]|nr:hypothetical protein [Persephonella sp.]
MQEDNILDMEFKFFDIDIKLEESLEIDLSDKEGFILINDVPFFKATINSVNNIFLAKIQKVLPLEESLEVEEKN